MQTVFDFLTGNWEAIVAVLVALHALALAVVNLTPTPRDNEILARVYRVVEMVGGIVTRKAKQ
ncbi:hypothetical protein UFOVP347_28 [uncultured Caudovirales phage]|uniref:Uncharacterized protein n=1 Tax=uncultured Caudovirales phage TaxID=2100421 RepID=A0A6J5LZY3_9CAUD|nr:hypothetical protein UFOVP347_28 [uncultured Caudovirales phage]